jgi:hypothetical protein
MNVYTVSEARTHLTSVLARAERDGEVLLKRKDGRLFIITPESPPISPLDVEGVTTGISSKEIVTAVRECRER